MFHIKIKLCVSFILLISWCATAQIPNYNYERSLKGISDDWHSVTIPDNVFGRLQPSFQDIRIYGINEKMDTIEVPYYLKVNKDHLVIKEHSCQIINSSKTDDGYFYTIKLNQQSDISDIKLLFADANFDWKVNLEGSHDQKQWFNILENYRILDIDNTSTNYSYTNLKFPTANYLYYRIAVKSDKQPTLTSVHIFMQKLTDGILIDYKVKEIKTSQDKKMKSSEVEFELVNPVPVSSIKINVNGSNDYFRPISMRYLLDSVKTEKGYLYDYTTFKRGTLTSLEDNEFEFNSTMAKKFKMVISNGDNQPLDIKSVEVKGFKYELIARFTESADYKLVYGNKSVHKPQYDIINFKNNVPVNIKALTVGNENQVSKKNVQSKTSLFDNELWLWSIMGIVILILGGFTYKMLGNTVKD